MRSPSKLRRTVAGLAVAGVVAGGITVGTASADIGIGDFFGGGDGPFGSGFLPSGGDSGGFDVPDFWSDLPEFGGVPGGGFANPADPGSGPSVEEEPPEQGQSQPTPTTTPDAKTPPIFDQGNTPTQPPRQPTRTRRLPAWVERVLERAGINLADLIKRQPRTGQTPIRTPVQTPGQQPTTPSQQQGSLPAQSMVPKAQLQRQTCGTPAYVRLYGTTVANGKFTSKAFIGGDNLGKTLVLGGSAYVVPFGDKLMSRSVANYVFMSTADAQTLSVQPRVAKNTVLEDRTRYRASFLTKGVTYTVIVRYVNTCGEAVTDVLGKVRLS